MTGIDLLRKELEERGYTAKQYTSPIVNSILDIVAHGNGEYTDLKNVREEAAKLREEIGELKRKSEAEMENYRRCCVAVNYYVENSFVPRQKYIDKFMEELKQCETPEGRDAMRIAQTFINACNIDTKYDNTAFIIGLSQILSVWNTGAIDMLRRINPEMPTVEFQGTDGKRLYGKSIKVTLHKGQDGEYHSCKIL